MNKGWLLLAGFLAVGLSGTVLADAYNANIAREAWQAVARVEKKNHIPRGLLHSMSLVETGQGLDGHVLPWPYTVGVNPTSSYKFNTPKAALAKLDKLRRIGFKRFNVKVDGKEHRNLSVLATEKLLLKSKEASLQLKGRHFSDRFPDASSAARFVEATLRLGYDNLDIGLMQINWHYHGKAFTTVEEAFDPVKNASYAVSYLVKHRQERDWWNSVGRYHSGTKEVAKKYIETVYAMYRRVHRLKDDNA